MTDSQEKELLYGIVSLMLPESMLDCFDIVKVEEEDIPATDMTFRPFKRMVNLYLDERDNRTSEQQCYSPNGFTEYTKVSDFPLRNRLVTLHIRRRRYKRTREPRGQVRMARFEEIGLSNSDRSGKNAQLTNQLCIF